MAFISPELDIRKYEWKQNRIRVAETVDLFGIKLSWMRDTLILENSGFCVVLKGLLYLLSLQYSNLLSTRVIDSPNTPAKFTGDFFTGRS